MISAVTMINHDIMYEGERIAFPEMHMLGTLPEFRGGGAINKMMDVVLREYKAQGHLFTGLIPFKFDFYRKYGFECASEMLIQKVGIEQFKGFTQEMTASKISSQADVDEARELYIDFVKRYNFADLKIEYEWTYKENGEFGFRDWEHQDKTHYSYILRDKDGKARAYFTFLYIFGPDGPFTGTMKVTELIFDGPEALRNVFGFFYGMRAKIIDVSLELPRDIDISLMVPECDEVKRSFDGHITARALNIDKILLALRQPQGEGKYSIHVDDSFLPENTGTYSVSFKDGRTTEVTKDDGTADLEVTVQTFCRLAAGLTGLEEAKYLSGTKLSGNVEILSRVFTRKPLLYR